MFGSGELSGLWPLTAVVSAVFSLPFAAAAFIGSRFRLRDAPPYEPSNAGT